MIERIDLGFARRHCQWEHIGQVHLRSNSRLPSQIIARDMGRDLPGVNQIVRFPEPAESSSNFTFLSARSG